MTNKQVLYINIGNTLMKFAIYKNNTFEIIKTIISANAIISESFINELKVYKIDYIAFSSTKPSKNKELQKLALILKINIYDIKNLNLMPYFNFLEKKFFGADLMCLSAATIEKYGKNNIVICLGTATTISLIIDSKYIGLIIIPGIGISAKALFNSAEMLNEFNFKIVNEKLKKNTKHAINLGIANSTQKLIKSWVEDIQKDYSNIKFKIILSGGYCDILNNEFLNYIKNKFLVFEGIHFYLIKNKLL